MQRHIDLEIQNLNKRIQDMGYAVEKSLEETLNALRTRDPQRLQEVRKYENMINQFHLEIDEKCLKVIASQSPLAADLRLILAIVKINSDLERMGDQAVNISLNLKDYLTRTPIALETTVQVMAIEVQKMVQGALSAFISRDVQLSEKILKDDDTVDEMKRSLFKELIALMKQDGKNVDPAIDLILVSRNLERLGDHATNIAEDVIFISTGKDIRHGGF